jgi:hypothetical protein
MGRKANRNKGGFDTNNKSQMRYNTLEGRLEQEQIKTESRKKYGFAMRAFNKSEIFTCQLFIGDSPFPRNKDLTINQMVTENRVLEAKFVSLLDKDIDTKRRLTKWKIKNPKSYMTDRQNFLDSFDHGVKEKSSITLL